MSVTSLWVLGCEDTVAQKTIGARSYAAIGAVERTTDRSRSTLYLRHSAAAHASLGQPQA
jgi:hypothetical protein